MPTPLLECYVMQGTTHTWFSPGLHDFCLVEVWGIVFTSVYLMSKSSNQSFEISSGLLDQSCNLSESVSLPVKWGECYLPQMSDKKIKFYVFIMQTTQFLHVIIAE